MLRVALAGVLVAVLIPVVGGPVLTGAAWALCGYLVWRAAPGVRRDVAGLLRRLPGAFKVPSLRRSRGERL